MKKYIIALFLAAVNISALFPQDNREIMQNLSGMMMSFEYSELIKTVDQLLVDKSMFNDFELKEIYRMKGLAHFARAEDRSARYSFIEILKIDSSYNLNPSTNSPKIITFFDEVKEEYLSGIRNIQDPVTIIKYDTVYVPVNIRDNTSEDILKNALIRSLIFPGTGHLYKQSNLKSWALTVLSAASIGVGIYYIIDTNKKERLYLEETNWVKIPDKYKDYNSSYRMRNFAFISFAAIWLYSQIDLLFFSDEDNSKLSFLPEVYQVQGNKFYLGYTIYF